MRRLLLAVVATLFAHPAAAQPASPVEMIETAPATLSGDTAYVLFRTNRFKTGILVVSPVFVRVPEPEELSAFNAAKRRAYEEALPRLQAEYGKRKDKAAEPPNLETFAFQYEGASNAFAVKGGSSLSDAGPYRTYLIAVRPGTYVLYGAARGPRVLDTCLCLGTVAFDAAPGEITDLGALVMDKVYDPSPIPELAAESGFGHPANGAPSPLGMALRRTPDAVAVPEVLAGLPIRPAALRAVGAFMEGGAFAINRLPPIAGVLAYAQGKVVDPRTGAEVPSGTIAR